MNFKKMWLAVACCFPLLVSAQGAPGADESVGTMTPCPGEPVFSTPVADVDVHVEANASLVVMYHGNRFVAAQALTQAFELENPGVKVTYTAVPPVNTLSMLTTGLPRLAILENFPMPDVVMLAKDNLANPQIAEKLEPGVKYSVLPGVVLLARADDSRIVLDEVERDANARWVFPSKQSIQRVFFQGPIWHYGYENVKGWFQAASTTFSDLRHHRSVPARILAGCADVGFQYKQSQKYLEDTHPGRFKFHDVPVPARILEMEDSYAAIVKGSPHRTQAEKFRKFMVGPTAQAILRQYGLALPQ